LGDFGGGVGGIDSSGDVANASAGETIGEAGSEGMWGLAGVLVDADDGVSEMREIRRSARTSLSIS
jgi:hypothetical protein